MLPGLIRPSRDRFARACGPPLTAWAWSGIEGLPAEGARAQPAHRSRRWRSPERERVVRLDGIRSRGGLDRLGQGGQGRPSGRR